MWDMVDFHSDATVTTPSWEILKILALEKRENLMIAIEFFYKEKYLEADEAHNIDIIRARLWCLYYELEAWLLRTFTSDAVTQLKAKIDSKKVDEVFEVVTFLNKFMDDRNLIRIDNIKPIDKTRVELENENDEY
jgi:hypothetical protein